MSEETTDVEATQETAPVEAASTEESSANEENSSWKARLRRRRRRTRSGRKRSNKTFASDNAGPHTAANAVGVLKKFKQPKFDQAVECSMHLGIDPRQADQQLRGAITMPHGTGKTARVVCFCGEDKVEAAKAAGAVEAGGDDLGEKIKGGWFDFDIAIASPDMMRVVGQLGRVLGPKGLMPSPKAGTVTPDVVAAVGALRSASFSSAMALHCDVVIVAMGSCGVPAPFSIPAASMMSAAAGDDLISKSKDRSA